MVQDNSVKWDRKDPSAYDYKTVNCLIVGGTGGLGRAISFELLKNGAKVTVVGQTLRSDPNPNLTFIKVDLSLVKNVQELVNDLNSKNLSETFTHVVLTTGIFASKQIQVTSEGVERDMAISYLSRYVILKGIASDLKKTFKQGDKTLKTRVFVMGYPGSNNGGDPNDMNPSPETYAFLKAHFNTVAANEALVIRYAKDEAFTDFNIYGLNPGFVKTDILSNLTGKGIFGNVLQSLIGWTHQTAESYAKKIAALLVAPEIEGNDGAFFDSKARGLLKSTNIDVNVDKFGESSEKLVQFATEKK